MALPTWTSATGSSGARSGLRPSSASPTSRHASFSMASNSRRLSRCPPASRCRNTRVTSRPAALTADLPVRQSHFPRARPAALAATPSRFSTSTPLPAAWAAAPTLTAQLRRTARATPGRWQTRLAALAESVSAFPAPPPPAAPEAARRRWPVRWRRAAEQR